MALDAICLQAIVAEIRPQLLGLRIDKVQQPVRDQVILLLRGNRRLLLSAGANAPRMHFTSLSRDNPAEPPMFCMLLRKHLVGARVAEITQPALERLVRLELDITDEFGRPGKRTLVLEAMGRRSNLILLDEEGRIIECMRRVDAEMSANRQVLPGLFYEPPAAVGRLPVTEETEEGFREKLAAANPERQVDAFLLDGYFGLSPLMARELAFRTAGQTDARLMELDGAGVDRLWKEIEDLTRSVKENKFTAICLKQEGRPAGFSCLPIAQYGSAMELAVYPSFSELLDDYYEAVERLERTKQRGADLIRTATSARERLRRKLALQEADYAATQNRDQLRVSGELITANLYRMERGQSQLRCENFYEENCPPVNVSLDPLLTPQQNAAKYYKRYTKAKTAEKYLREQMELARRDLTYLESVLEEIAEAESEQDFSDIRGELRESGFLRRQSGGKKEQKRASKPREFRTSSGLRVLVGRNNRQNDKLTMKDSDRRDLWFHTQKIHGSHVILCTGGKEVDDDTIVEAAKLAAWYSQARESGNVPVDYTQVKNVKKPAGGRPGMVTYSTCRTVNVLPDGALVKRLSVK
ncbi:NFACT RNA binding domain-containing protein [Oscillibacter sp.]|uniref:Rqc2 family fibronectin-binding protein n=1 Tax=Oscillibacter sp. TaxID=1945593 RepID=UPI0026067D15|nr:NFACT RNA binding domain-containing protein [Oscillibacter sp.]MDD3346905.1 NFACT RNA binding domain-containing protein [Oscillibacter sp.]